MNNLGYCFKLGNGVEANAFRATQLFKQSADLGNSFGMLNLGVCYEEGHGVEQNLQAALALFEQGAALGHEACKSNAHRLRLSEF